MYKTSRYVRAHLRLTYEVFRGIEIGTGLHNLFDEYYVLTDGFPEAGRSFSLSAKVRL